MDRSRPKGPDYLVMDNLDEIFGLNKADLISARKEAEKLTEAICDEGITARCDILLWIKALDTHPAGIPAT